MKKEFRNTIIAVLAIFVVLAIVCYILWEEAGLFYAAFAMVAIAMVAIPIVLLRDTLISPEENGESPFYGKGLRKNLEKILVTEILGVILMVAVFALYAWLGY